MATSPTVPVGMRAGSRLERVLRSGRFAVTAELNPPDSADPQSVYARALLLAEVCDGINATDASGAHVHMSSVGVCALLTRAGYEPVMQVSCRDRNRIAIQGDLLGAAAMGVCNVLCLTGDGVQVGDQPEAKAVFDLDAITLLRTARILRDEQRFLSGRKLDVAPRLFLGAAANPFAPPYDFRLQRLAKKVTAGADFIQTQYCYDVPRLRQFMAAVCDLGLHEKVTGGAQCKSCWAITGKTWFTQRHHRETPDRIEKGQADVGIVWTTEIIEAKKHGRKIDGVAIPAPYNKSEKVGYAIGALKTGRNQANAAAYLEYLASDEAQKIYAKYGFVPATKAELKLRPIPAPKPAPAKPAKAAK